MSGKLFPLSAALLLVVSSGLCTAMAEFIRHDRELAAYKHLGQQEAFQCVGEVTFVDKPGQRAEGKAAAVLIAPRWALTAGHVVASTALERQRYKSGDEQYRAIRRVLHPGYNPEAADPDARLAITIAGVDLALIQLDRPVRNVPPAARYRGEDEVGQTMTKIGYGVIGNGTAGPLRPFTQQRLGGSNVIDAAGGTFGDVTVTQRVLLCDFDAPNDATRNRLGEPAPLELEVGSSPGDSGGGWFIRDGCSWKLVAITSGEVPRKGDSSSLYGAVSAGMRVSKANVWIDTVIHGVDCGRKGRYFRRPVAARPNTRRSCYQRLGAIYRQPKTERLRGLRYNKASSRYSAVLRKTWTSLSHARSVAVSKVSRE